MNPVISEIHAMAVSAVNQGQYAEVDRLCDQILSRDSAFAEAWFLKSMAAAGRLEVGRALALLPKAIKLAPGNADYWAQFAKLCTLVNEDQRAKNAAEQAAALDPTSPLTLDTLGVVFTKLGRYEDAQKYLQQAVAKSPGNPQFQFNLASAEQFLGNEEAAEQHYRQAIKIAPGFARAHWALSELKKVHSDAEQQQTLESLLAQKELIRF